MKKLLMILALLASIPMFAERVDPETARKVATTFLSNNGAKTAQLTDLSKDAGFANLYIFTTDESFVVMAADDCVKPILGYSLTGNFETEGMPENMKWWLQQYSDEIQWRIESIIPANENIVTEWKELTTNYKVKDTPITIVAPLLSTNWDQDAPYNLFCPSGTVTGCVATAMAQVMKYWNYPEQGQGTHTNEYNNSQTVDFSEATYEWNLMINNYHTTTSTQEQKEAVARLIYHCGVSVDMKYGAESGAASSKVPVSLVEYFKYAPSATFISKEAYTDEQWIAFIQSELDEHRPVFYAGNFVTNDGETGGHAFVCDGYRSDNYFHFNWGWSGNKDEYYAIGALNPNPSSGNAIGSGTGTYNLGNGIAAWVEPISSLSAPSIAATATNGAIIISWNASKDAVSYDIYRDNIKIATNVTENNYIDNSILSGIYYEYYVRAVSGNTRSNPSNRVTKSCFIRDYTPSNLTGILTNDDAVLTWEEPVNNSTTLQYATGYSGTRYGMGEAGKDNYWAEVFDSSRLTDFVGMRIEKVSAYLYFPGSYKLFIYQDTPTDESNKLIEQSFSVSSQAQRWVDIELSNPLTPDCNKDLWIIMYYPYTEGSLEPYWYPAPCGNYDEIPFDDEENLERYNPRWIGDAINHWYYVGANISWLFRTYLTDGSYTYNIYDGTSIVNNNEPIIGSNFTVENITNNDAHLFTVKTNYYGGESSPSNMIGFAKGNATFEGTLALGDNDKMTVTAGSALTVTGDLSNGHADNLVIEDGAQLIHHSDDVMATYQKDIAGYIGDGGWFTIAIPFASYTPTGSMISSEYDLYAYIENGAKEWDNYKPESFDLLRSSGYLYAHNPGITLNMTGTLVNGDYTENVDLSYGNTNADLRGYNLLGNPTAHDITFTKTEKVSDGYYYLDNSESWIYANNNTVPAGRGFLVKANAENQTVTLNPRSKNGDGDGETQGLASLQIDVDGASVYVKMTDGVSMPLLSFKSKSQGLYLSQDGKPYVMLVKGDNDNLSLHYKARENGTHTIHLSPLTFNFSPLTYLHLIDNLTGADIDLLKTPSYTFESQATDYEARFRLVFRENANPSEDSDVFAYYADGYIHLLGIHDNATIQVIDATGRVIANTTTRSLTTTGWRPGVYVIRLMDENSNKTQKIINNK